MSYKPKNLKWQYSLPYIGKSMALKAWVAALRSGQYNQCKYMLHNYLSGSYCAMGVLRPVLAKNPNGMFDAYNAAEWLIGDDNVIAQWNDKLSLTFAQIADGIERDYF